MVPVATTEYDATEKIMADEEYLAAAAKNENDATKKIVTTKFLSKYGEKTGTKSSHTKTWKSSNLRRIASV